MKTLIWKIITCLLYYGILASIGQEVARSIPGSAKYTFPRIDDSYCDRIHSSLDDGYVASKTVIGKKNPPE